MKVCHKTCIFCFFPIINKYFCMAKRSLLSRCPSYIAKKFSLFCSMRITSQEHTSRYNTYMFTYGSWGGVVGIVTRLADGQFGIRIPTSERRVSLNQNVQTGSCIQPASYSVGTNRVVMLTTHLDIVPGLRMSGAISPLPLRLHGVSRNSCT